jgi:type I restriction enzyme S subunit
MKRRWKVTTVQEFVDKGEVELKTGPFGTQLHASDYVEKGTPVINVRNIGFGSVVPEKLEFLDNETVSRLSGHLLRKGDIVFGRKGAVERHAHIREEQNGWFQGSDCLRLRIRSAELNSSFVSYTLLTEAHKQWMMNQCSHGATMASLNQAIICRIPLWLPDISTQNRIAEILSAYDDLIENNTRRFKILEQMAQMLYREWFVNFRVPGHEKVKMVESELGQIPATWSVLPMNDVVNEIIDYRGKTPKKLGSDWANDGVVALSALNVKHGRLESLDKAKRVDDDLYKRWMKSELDEGDILMTSEAPLGEAFILTQKRKYCLSQRLFSIRANPQCIFPSLLYLFLGSHGGQGQIRSRSTGTTVLGIRQSELRKVIVPIPEFNLQKRMNSAVWPLLKQIDSLARKNENLRNTRDLLLPKLVSGEVSVESLEEEALAETV